MSDPVTNVEIEDVLSSIRRLVSDEARTMERARAARGGAAAEPEDQKLVLTPALRVSEIEPGEGGEPVAEELEAEMFVPEHEHQGDLDDGDVEDAEAVDIAPEGDEQEDEPEDALTTEHPFEDVAEDGLAEDESIEELPTEDEAALEEAEEIPQVEEDNPEPPVEDLQSFASDEASASLQDKIAQLEALIGQSKEQFEPDIEGQDEYAGDATEAIEWEDAEPEAEEAPEQDDADEGFADAPEEAETAADEGAVAVEEETDEAPAEPDLEADAVESSEDAQDFAPEALVEAEQEEAEAEPEKPADVELAEDLRMLSDDDAVLDEETLREIVTDIVREELQGALGERITRNVRKLVRREIHRALSSQEFD